MKVEDPEEGEEFGRVKVVTFSERTVRDYVRDGDKTCGLFTPSQQGHHAKVKWLLDDVVLRQKFISYVEENGVRKGEYTIING